MRILSALTAFLLFGFVGTEVLAEPEKVQADFDVTGFSINADLPKPEICLTFSAPIQHKDRNRILSSLTLYKDGKKSKISPDQLSVTPNDLCVQRLEHRSTYNLTIKRLQNASGKRLTQAYSNTFLMPDRKAALFFVEERRAQKMPRHVKETRKTNDDTVVIEQGRAHVLRSINVMATHLSLYRIEDREAFPAAWQHFKINHIAPSESLSFARQRGQLVFESDLVFGDKPNEEQTLVAPLPHDDALLPGLYYLAATPRGKEGSDITLFAGQWFLVSDLQFTASRFGEGLAVFASADKEKGNSPAIGVEIAVLNPEGGVVGEGKTDQNGFVYLGLDPDKMKQAAIIVGKAANGNLSLLEAKGMQAEGAQTDYNEGATIYTGLTSYKFGEQVGVFLLPRDIKKLFLAKEETVVKLLRPDRRPYSEDAVRFEDEDISFKTIQIPLSGQRGRWSISWEKKDGTKLGEAAINVGIRPESAKIQVELDHSSLGKDTTLGATIIAQDDKGKPLPLENGALILSSTYPEIDGWKAYRFGDATAQRESLTKRIPFLTNEAGKAYIQLTQKDLIELKFETVRGLSISASLERGGLSQAIAIPVRTLETMVGIRMLPDDLSPPENSDALFDVVSVDMVGKRRAENNLHYVLYEEGRSFKWFQSEGRWDYQPLPTHRRVAGGAFDINSAGDNLIRVPVRTGQYVLEIATVSGDVLARYGFDAGRHAYNSDKGKQSSKVRVLKLPKEIWVGGENKITLDIEKETMVNVLVWDGQVRQTISRYMSAGQNEVVLEPTASWGKQVQLHIQSLASRSQKEEKHSYQLPVRLLEDGLLVKASGPLKIMGDEQASVSVAVQKIVKSKTIKVMALTSFMTEEGQDFVAPVRGNVVEVDAEGKAVVPISLSAKPRRVKITLFAWNDAQFGSTMIDGGVPASSDVVANVPQFMTVGDKTSLSFTINNHTATAIAYDYQIEATHGVVLGGNSRATIKLLPGMKKSVPVSFSAREAAQGEVRLSLKRAGKEVQKFIWPYLIREGDRSMHEGLSQPIQEKQSLHLEAKTKVLISPVDYPNAMVVLRSFVEAEPFTTEEIALWLEVMQEWHPLAYQLGLLSEANYNILRAQRLLELRRRQNDDGGFSAVKAGDTSDLISTAAALRLVHPSFERQSSFAIEWLMGRLQNTWFDESERNARAYAFQVLSKINKADLSSLRYFAETSKGKDLPVSVSAMLAIALVHAGDETMAKPWISQVHQALSKTEGDGLDRMRAIALIAFHETTLHKVERLDNIKQTIEGSAWVLMAMQRLSHRMKDWAVQVGDTKSEHNGVWGFAGSHNAYDIQNTSNLPLYVILEKDISGGNKEVGLPSKAIHQATLYTTEGEIVESGTVLSVGKSYLLSLHISAKTVPDGSLYVIVNPSSAYATSIPAHGRAGVIESVYPFLPQPIADMQNVTPVVAGVGYEQPLMKEWRSVISVTPLVQGSFAFPTITMRDNNGVFYQISNVGRFSVE